MRGPVKSLARKKRFFVQPGRQNGQRVTRIATGFVKIRVVSFKKNGEIRQLGAQLAFVFDLFGGLIQRFVFSGVVVMEVYIRL